MSDSVVWSVKFMHVILSLCRRSVEEEDSTFCSKDMPELVSIAASISFSEKNLKSFLQTTKMIIGPISLGAQFDFLSCSYITKSKYSVWPCFKGSQGGHDKTMWPICSNSSYLRSCVLLKQRRREVHRTYNLSGVTYQGGTNYGI